MRLFLHDNAVRDGGARAHFYNPSRGEWIQWINMLPPLEIPDEAKMGDIVVPNAYTAQYNSLLTLLLNRDKKVGDQADKLFVARLLCVLVCGVPACLNVRRVSCGVKIGFVGFGSA